MLYLQQCFVFWVVLVVLNTLLKGCLAFHSALTPTGCLARCRGGQEDKIPWLGREAWTAGRSLLLAEKRML